MTLTEKYSVAESIRNGNSTIEFWDNGIIYIKLDDNSEVTLKDAKASYNFLKERYNGKDKHRVLTEPGRYSTVSKEAREFATLPETNEMTLANAVVVRSLAHKIIINFIIGFIRQQNMGMRMFDNKEKAIEWLINLENK